MGEKMSLERVRDGLRKMEPEGEWWSPDSGMTHWTVPIKAWADTIDAHITQPAQAAEWKAPEERYRGVPFAVLGKAFQHVLADPRVVWRDNGGAQTFIDRVQGETATLLAASPAPSEGGKGVEG